MKNSFWAYWLILLGVFVVVIMLLVQNLTTSTTQDYYLVKEITDAALIDAVDYTYYRTYGEIKINKEKFYESFMRRFAETASLSTTYTVSFYGVYEAPPKASVEVKSVSNTFNVASDSTSFDMVERIDAILEGNVINETDIIREQNNNNNNNNNNNENNNNQQQNTADGNDFRTINDGVIRWSNPQGSYTSGSYDTNSVPSEDIVNKSIKSVDYIKSEKVGNYYVHSACLYFNGREFCIKPNYWVSGDVTGSSTEAKLKSEMDYAFGTTMSNCVYTTNYAKCYYGEQYSCYAQKSGRVKCSDQSKYKSNGILHDSDIDADGSAASYGGIY